ncbi:heme A synthase [Marinoscillum sp. MHG1-6]|uniref:COX15/CtaA family protein n=1 Tax=Marinoscillum sp. MHG1-6 TaxID=2959627 RepID=UPI002157836D|nr:COX15/CtaA family protein [Marinoscillum sp. MHG1-6]
MPNNNRFYKINLYTIIAVYFLILVGGIVRSTGSGMGCPDWPKCFGNYIPPVSDEKLPSGYEEIYARKRLEKNNRLAEVLGALGLNELSDRVLNDPEISEETEFDTTKAWTEYVNRLIGVAIGLFIMANLFYSYKSGDSTQLWLGLAGFILVLFQGWVGSLVVSTNLLPGFITFHMFLALLLVGLLMYQNIKITGAQTAVKGRWAILVLLVLFSIQVLLGTGVREQIDVLNGLGILRGEWIDNLSTVFLVHRSYSLVLIALLGYILYLNRSELRGNYYLLVLSGLFLIEILLGVILTYVGFPAFAQPIHLFVGSLAFGVIFYLFLNSRLYPSAS